MKIQDIDKAEILPTKTNIRSKDSGFDDRRCDNRRDFPYSHAKRWLKSHIGHKWNDIISEFIHAEWVPVKHRNLESLNRYLWVEVNTFMENGKVMYYGDYTSHNEPKPVEEKGGQSIYYVHPKTLTLNFYKSKRVDWAAIHKAEQDKVFRSIDETHQLHNIDGIWYMVEAKFMTDVFRKRFPLGTPWEIGKILLRERAFGWRPLLFDTTRKIKSQLSKKQLQQYGLENSR